MCPRAADSANLRPSIRHYSLMNALLAVLGSTRYDETNNVLARYFLEHFDDLSSLNVYEVAEACYTSRTGIRRFCQAIGLDNFSDLKSYAWEWERHRRLFVDYTDHENFRPYLAQAIAAMLIQVDSLASESKIDALARALYQAHEVVLLTSDFSSMAMHQFQQSMLYLHKIVRIVTDSMGDVGQIDTLGPKDLLVVISEHGGYARAVQSRLDASEVSRALITVDCDPQVVSSFDIEIRLDGIAPSAGRSVFAQYGVSYLLDILYHRYWELFGAE